MSRINYEGKMTDEYPAWVWKVVSEYTLNPFDYIKVIECLKSKYGRRKPKIYFATIEEITKSPNIVKPKLRVLQLGTGESSDNGTLYYFKTKTSFEIGIENNYYYIEQEGLIWVSEVMSQVLERQVRMYNKNKKLLVEVK